jgi:hypothetical protein
VVGHEAEDARGALSAQKGRRKMLERISEDKFPKGPGGQGLLKRLGLVAAHLVHRAFHGKNQVVFRASFGVTPAVQLLAAPEEDLTLMLKSLTLGPYGLTIPFVLCVRLGPWPGALAVADLFL